MFRKSPFFNTHLSNMFILVHSFSIIWVKCFQICQYYSSPSRSLWAHLALSSLQKISECFWRTLCQSEESRGRWRSLTDQAHLRRGSQGSGWRGQRAWIMSRGVSATTHIVPERPGIWIPQGFYGVDLNTAFQHLRLSFGTPSPFFLMGLHGDCLH